ncbi:protein of unknown function [Ruminococcaceae bacterium BL-6]|nr:protein of unknown function [Ruminococcaceae bacterium BL-6]
MNHRGLFLTKIETYKQLSNAVKPSRPAGLEGFLMSIAYAPKYIGTDMRPDWLGLKSPACDSRANRQAPSRRSDERSSCW